MKTLYLFEEERANVIGMLFSGVFTSLPTGINKLKAELAELHAVDKKFIKVTIKTFEEGYIVYIKFNGLVSHNNSYEFCVREIKVNKSYIVG
jgi:hypothetical protein